MADQSSSLSFMIPSIFHKELLPGYVQMQGNKGKLVISDYDDLNSVMYTLVKQLCLQDGASSSTSAAHVKKRKLKKAAMVEIEVRHNVRIQKQSKGF